MLFRLTIVRRIDGMKGTGHYIAQRVTAIGLVPCALWLVFFIVKLSSAGNIREVGNLILSPWNGTFLLLFLTLGLYHAKLGISIIIDDYVHLPCLKKFLRICLTFVCLISFIAAIVTLIYLHFIIMRSI
ncbi:MAG: succinate dehydrogenase, hydrophobic membrane anchor protein [Candidatus Lariskella arthropodorum]|uniref:succinate dehydrogenase, hydrophobic membrane anchor protein n=1 Tax=Candidatus Lariskella endosymbiont of Epinotia ramella TaxID=3066224 RepID=UPI0030D35172